MIDLKRVLACQALLFLSLLGSRQVQAADTDTKDKATPADRAAAKPVDDEKKVSVRIVVLKGAYEDHPSAVGLDPFSMLSGDMEKPNSFFALCEKLDELADNEDIQHVVFDISAPDFHMNLAQLSELNRHIQKLRATKKRTFAWLESADTRHYAAACACDTILMADLGMLDLPSLSMSTLHFRDAMDLIGAQASVARVGDFKGAVEPFTLSEMSQGLRTHYKEMLTTMNDALVERIATARKLKATDVRKLQGERLFTAKAAQKAELVDKLAPYGTMREAVAKSLGEDVNWVTLGRVWMKKRRMKGRYMK